MFKPKPVECTFQLTVYYIVDVLTLLKLLELLIHTYYIPTQYLCAIFSKDNCIRLHPVLRFIELYRRPY